MKQGKSREVPDHELLERIQARIARMYQTGRIQVVDGREIITPEAKRERTCLEEQRDALELKLGPTQVLGGIVHHVRVHGKAYAIAPYAEWLDELLRATAITFNPRELIGTHPMRNRLVWLVWHFRDKAVIQVGATAHKVRGSLVECVECGYRHRYLGRPRDEHGISRCRRCSCLTYRTVPEEIAFRPFGKVTRSGLQRRFRLSKRYLDRVLAVPLP